MGERKCKHCGQNVLQSQFSQSRPEGIFHTSCWMTVQILGQPAIMLEELKKSNFEKQLFSLRMYNQKGYLTCSICLHGAEAHKESALIRLPNGATAHKACWEEFQCKTAEYQNLANKQ